MMHGPINITYIHTFDNDVELKDWPHPASDVKITVKTIMGTTVQAHTDGSK